MKDLNYYLNLDYKLTIETENFEGSNYFICYSVELGKYSCYGQGDSINESIESFLSEKDSFIQGLYESKLPIPEPADKADADLLSGVFSVRTSPIIHTELSENAKRNNLSLNQYVNQIISRGSILDSFIDKITPQFNRINENIWNHDCSVRKQLLKFSIENNLTNTHGRSVDEKVWEEEYEPAA